MTRKTLNTATKNHKSNKSVRGAKTAAIVELALRPQGVSGVEIMEATGWPSGSAGWRVGTLADRLGFTMSDRIYRDDGTIGYRLIDPNAKKSTPTSAPRKVNAKVVVNKAPRRR